MAMARSDAFKTPLARLSYAQSLYKPRAQQEGGKEKYGATLIFENKDRGELEKHVLETITKEWGDKAVALAKSGMIKSPFLAGDGKEARRKDTGELHPGMGADKFFIRVQANSDRPPWVRYRDPNKQETEDVVYSGCFVKAVLNCFAWEHPTNGKGVSFGIEGLQKLQDGERLGGSGGQNPEKWVEVLEDAGEAPPETKTGAGASGLFG